MLKRLMLPEGFPGKFKDKVKEGLWSGLSAQGPSPDWLLVRSSGVSITTFWF